jgi:hypothetical protein
MNNVPNPVQYLQCAALVAKVMISADGKFTESEIELADELLGCSWNNSVTHFLHVVAGIAHAGIDVYDETWAALTFKREKS